MSGKVFISCGQSGDDELNVAKEISDWFIVNSYKTYVAVQIHTLFELNSEIIDELKSSDFFLFVNFKRERIIKKSESIIYRGSLFANQELSIAYSMNFEKMLFINQKHVIKEGVLKYFVSNTPEFENYNEVLEIVKNAVKDSDWNPTYSRNLICDNLRWSDTSIRYIDHTGIKDVKVLYIDVNNNRPDIGALDTVARLKSITLNGETRLSSDRSDLKCAGAMGYSKTIWPNDHIAFDLLSIDMNTQINVYLHSSLDVRPRRPIISEIGTYILEYEVYATSFPVLTFKVQLDLTGNISTSKAVLY